MGEMERVAISARTRRELTHPVGMGSPVETERMIRPSLSTLMVLLVALSLSACAFESFGDPVILPPDSSEDGGNDDPDVGESTDMGETPLDSGPEDVGPDTGPEDMGGDAHDAEDMSDMDDTGGDVGQDMGADMGCTDVVQPLTASTSGEECTPYDSDIQGPCDVVTQTGCPDGQHCSLSLLISDGTVTGFATACRPYNCEMMTKTTGQACSPGECAPGYQCYESICRRRCYLDGAIGCEAGQFCYGDAVSREFGRCLPECP